MGETAEIVERLGGRGPLSARFKVSVKAIEMWERRGWIPGRWHVECLVLANELGVPLSLEELSTTSRSPARAA